MSDVYAHSLPDTPDHSRWETLSHHLRDVGQLASEFADVFGAADWARAAGLLHDIGKTSRAYQRYIRTPGANRGPDHSTAGAREAIELYGPKVGRLIAYGIAGHHGGLMDGSGSDGRGSSLDLRLSKDDYPTEPYDGWQDHVDGLPALADLLTSRLDLDPEHPGFSLAFRARMLFSCLVDADFLATERFYASAEHGEAPPRGGVLRAEHLERVRAFMAGRSASDTAVNRLRAEILDHAIGKAGLPPGHFTLTVPTGGGKTLTSLRFALEHAQTHGLRRIIYVIPFTSIIEQTADVFRNQLGLGDAVLEHHSSFDWDELERRAENDAEGEGAAGLAKLRRDTENWDAPIIVTTGVQFWESLFASRTSRARKLHNLAKSVIILDEAQTLPVKLLRPCMAALEELKRSYGASVVLCTATQPALRRIDNALPTPEEGKHSGRAQGFDIDDSRELAPRPRELYQELKRVDVEWRRDPVDDSEIAARFAAQDRMLVIVNSRAHARDLFEAIRDLPGARHLTTLMCAMHRRQVLAGVRADLAARRPTRLVATSLIEAGVDVDFPEVWRAATGLDSIAQASGRCNREGLLEGVGRTIVFEPADEVKHKVPAAIMGFYQAARQVLRTDADPLGLDAVTAYFQELYFQQGYGALDAATLNKATFPILRETEARARDFSFPFSRIAHAFRLIDDAMEPIIVPFDEAAQTALQAVRHADKPPRGVLRTLQQYVVPVPKGVRAKMLASGAVQAVKPEAYEGRFMQLASMDLYHPQLGLDLEDPTFRSSERNIF
jgi:CRISPR-associated endonuclease/helicase Cas3